MVRYSDWTLFHARGQRLCDAYDVQDRLHGVLAMHAPAGDHCIILLMNSRQYHPSRPCHTCSLDAGCCD